MNDELREENDELLEENGKLRKEIDELRKQMASGLGILVSKHDNQPDL